MKNDKHELTDKLKKIETLIHDSKIELKSLNQKLKTAYDYEEELNKRVVWAKERTLKHRLEYLKKAREISTHYNDMKKIFDVFTGNFYQS